MDGGSRKGQVRWNISLETGLQIYSVVFAKNYRVGDSEACRCLDPAGIPACACYRMHPQIMFSRLDLGQAREGCMCHDRLSMPMCKKMGIIRNGV